MVIILFRINNKSSMIFQLNQLIILGKQFIMQLLQFNILSNQQFNITLYNIMLFTHLLLLCIFSLWSLKFILQFKIYNQFKKFIKTLMQSMLLFIKFIKLNLKLIITLLQNLKARLPQLFATDFKNWLKKLLKMLKVDI